VISSRCPQTLLSPPRLAEPVETIKGGVLRHLKNHQSSICQHSHSHHALLEGRKPCHAGAIQLASEIGVVASKGIHNFQEELSARPETTPKNSLTVQWTVGEVVGVEYALAPHSLPRLALPATWCRPTTATNGLLRVQAG
jgi:hypothetical protein